MKLKDRTTHLMLMLPVGMVQEIKDFQEDNRIRTNHEAVRMLIKKGLVETQE